MARYWTTYWQHQDWRNDTNPEGELLSVSGSNIYTRRGVSAGDMVYVVSMNKGYLYLGGRIIVSQITSRKEAILYTKNPDLYQANEWIIALKGTESPLHLYRRLHPEITKQLLFKTSSGHRSLLFRKRQNLDSQTLRGVRELTARSAHLLDQIIEIEYEGNNLTVTAKMLSSSGTDFSVNIFADDKSDSEELTGLEGEIKRLTILHRRREKRLRKEKIAQVSLENNGALVCEVPNCGFDFHQVYGSLGKDYAQVHHLLPLSSSEKIRETHLKDLAIVCANCHAMIHRGGQCRPLIGLIKSRP